MALKDWRVYTITGKKVLSWRNEVSRDIVRLEKSFYHNGDKMYGYSVVVYNYFGKFKWAIGYHYINRKKAESAAKTYMRAH